MREGVVKTLGSIIFAVLYLWLICEMLHVGGITNG